MATRPLGRRGRRGAGLPGRPDAELPRWLAGLHRRLSALTPADVPHISPAAGIQ